jgi:hypothetical protein
MQTQILFMYEQGGEKKKGIERHLTDKLFHHWATTLKIKSHATYAPSSKSLELAIFFRNLNMLATGEEPHVQKGHKRNKISAVGGKIVPKKKKKSS